jgi:hypothetical protein
MDVAHSLFALIDKGGGDRADFQRSIGLIGSLLEGRTFDGLFNRAIGTGVSAVQLLREANEQQIPIFQVTPENYATVAPQLQLGSEIQGAIANAVAAGKTVLVSQRAPMHGNWSGVGYIVEDPATGAAAYLINGGLNGGADDPCDPERRPEPVRVPVLEIVFALALILLIILILIMLPEIVIAMGEILAAAGPVLARLAIVLGLAAAPLPAMAAGGGGPGPGEGISPPGNCTPEQYATLVAAKVATCDSPPACRGTDCATLTQALTRLQGCVAARETLMVTCFAGGDRRHIDELDAAMRAVANCACRVARHCL